MITREKLIELGNAHNFLNFMDNAKSDGYWPYDIAYFTDVSSIEDATDSIETLYKLLCDIYKEEGIS